MIHTSRIAQANYKPANKSTVPKASMLRASLALGCSLLSLALAPSVAKAQRFSQDGAQILFSRSDSSGGAALAYANSDGSGVQMIPNSSGSSMGVWSPDGRFVLFVDANKNLRLFTRETQTTRVLTTGVEAPLSWREDGEAFAGIKVTQVGNQPPTRALCRFDIEGHILGSASIGNLHVEPRYLLRWITNTDELAIFARNAEGTDCYVTDSNRMRRVTTSHDLRGLGMNAGGGHLIWARRGENLRYIMMTLYRYDTVFSTVERMPFPQRLPLLNPNAQTAPESIQDVVFSRDGEHLLLTAVVKQSGASGLNLYSLNLDGSDMRFVHRFANSPSNIPAFPAQFSYDGKRVVWQDQGTLFVSSADGTGKNRITLASTERKSQSVSLK